jgi:hypothetical protein
VPANAGAMRNHVGYASMRIIEVPNREWTYNLKDLAKYGYIMTYTSFKKVVTKLRETRMKPKTLELLNSKILLTPENTEAVAEFHENINQGFDNYLNKMATQNDCLLIIFNSIEPHRVLDFIDNRQDNILITVMVYYLDSNSLGMKYIPLNKSSFRDFIRLKSTMHQAITEALEEAIVNSSGLMPVSQQSTNSISDNNIPDNNNNSNNNNISNNPNNVPMKPKNTLQQQLQTGAATYGDAWD